MVVLVRSSVILKFLIRTTVSQVSAVYISHHTTSSFKLRLQREGCRMNKMNEWKKNFRFSEHKTVRNLHPDCITFQVLLPYLCHVLLAYTSRDSPAQVARKHLKRRFNFKTYSVHSSPIHFCAFVFFLCV